ncbi:hypothetical protein BsWGS_07734 [Bradybaena similaris]
MKTTLALMLLISMVPVVQGNAEKDPHHDQQVEAIAGLKDRLKTLRDYIDRLNNNVCQSSVSATPICDANDEFGKLFKCLTTTPVTKRVAVDFSRDFEAAPVIAAGITGMSGYVLNVQVSDHDVQKDTAELQVKTEDLFTIVGISTGVFSCPHGLVPGHGHSH